MSKKELSRNLKKNEVNFKIISPSFDITYGLGDEDVEKLIEKAANTAPAQTIRLEQAPMVIASSPTPTKKG